MRELKDLLYGGGGNFEKFFPAEFEGKIKTNFKLFDRDVDGYIDMDQVKTLLVSIDVSLEPKDIDTIYNELYEQDKGINEEDFLLFVMKKLRDENKEAEMLKHFKVIDKECSGLIKDADAFKDLLMSKGLRMTEQEVEEMFEVLNPKGTNEFSYAEFCKVVTTKDDGKKKKGKKVAKKGGKNV